MSQTATPTTFDAATSERVIDAVADATDSDPTDVGPLYHVVDPDALDRLFAPTHRGACRTGHVQFTFGGCEVTVRADGEIEVERLDAGFETEHGRE
jgi:hypothetical protein